LKYIFDYAAFVPGHLQIWPTTECAIDSVTAAGFLGSEISVLLPTHQEHQIVTLNGTGTLNRLVREPAPSLRGQTRF
jgi:hypothetical protein